MKVFLNAIIVHTLLNLYVFWRGWMVLPPKKTYKVPFALLFALELLVYLLGFIFAETLPHDLLHYIMLVGTSWMVFILYMTMLLIVSDLVWIVSLWIKKIAEIFDVNSHKVRRGYYCVSVCIVIVAMIIGSYNFWHPQVTERNVVVQKTASSVKNLRIAMVSDIHLGYLIDRNILHMYVDKILEQKPDVIFLVGDIIDYDLPYLQEQRMDLELRRLSAPYGVYASTGNHEYRLNGEEKIKWLSNEAGLTVLRDSALFVANSFYVVGREDDKAPHKKKLSDILSKVDKSFPVLVMNHEPHFLEEEADNKVDVAFYGHTHDGQLFPANLLVKTMYELSHGYKKKGNTHIFVSSGLGLSGPQYRIGTISEIMVVNVTIQK